MSFLSYAQNFEDVMLWRALKNVKKGFYIDVGANDPSIDSVTKAFYDRGWSGINIEPLPSHYNDLLRERPRDKNLQYVAGVARGEVNIWECDVRGWASVDKSVIAIHAAEGHQGVFHQATVISLSEICAEHVKGEIHFLKIDVEGFEKQVIEGMNFAIYRPWILVIEATRPNSPEETDIDWENNVLSNNYVFAYFDGLNRFYVAKEHSELLTKFRNPPNVFDDFIRVENLNYESRAQQGETRAQFIAEAKVQQAEIKVQQAENRARQAEATLLELHSSYYWRITSPLRWAVFQADLIKRDGFTARFKRFARKFGLKLLRHGALFFRSRPLLRKPIAYVASILGVDKRLRELYSLDDSIMRENKLFLETSLEFKDLTPRAQKILAALKVANDRKKEASGCV